MTMQGHLIAFEGLDQSGKQTQAELLRDRLKQEGHKARLVSFPDYATSIGEELARALQGERDYGPDVMQLLYIANRYERKPDLQRWLDGGLILVCDRYVASSIAYGEAQGLSGAWLAEIQRFLPPPSLTIVLDIAPETAVAAEGRSIAIGTSATCRCRRASARATWRRPPALLPGTGSCSTASGPGTRSPPTCSARWRHDSRCRKRAHFPHARRAFVTRAQPSSGRAVPTERPAGRASIARRLQIRLHTRPLLGNDAN